MLQRMGGRAASHLPHLIFPSSQVKIAASRVAALPMTMSQGAKKQPGNRRRGENGEHGQRFGKAQLNCHRGKAEDIGKQRQEHIKRCDCGRNGDGAGGASRALFCGCCFFHHLILHSFVFCEDGCELTPPIVAKIAGKCKSGLKNCAHSA